MLRSPRPVALLALLCAAWMLGACSLSRPTVAKRSFLLGAERSGATTTSTAPNLPHGAAPPALRVNRFVVAQPFDGRPLVYRAGDLRYEIDFYNEFLASPATMLTERTMRWLADARLFSAVVPMTSNVHARHVLEGTVWTMHGDYRNREAPTATIGIRFLLARYDGAGPMLLDHSFTRTVQVTDHSPDRLVAAFDEALGSILGDLEGAIVAALRNDREP